MDGRALVSLEKMFAFNQGKIVSLSLDSNKGLITKKRNIRP